MTALTEIAPGVIVRDMLTLDDAIDFACVGLAAKTRADYGRLLNRFADTFEKRQDVAKITEQDCIRFLESPHRQTLLVSTRAWEERVLDSFFKKLVKGRKIKSNPMDYLSRTRRPDSDSLNRKTISSAEVKLMFEAARTPSERLCIAILAYLGPRRRAASQLTIRDYDQLRGRLRFHEKGDKWIWKPIPNELRALIDNAIRAGVISRPVELGWANEQYLIPPEGPLKDPSKPRDDRVVWRLVNRIAYRAGVDAHTHSLRAAFADFCLDSGTEGKALQLLMGHSNPATTEIYIRRYDKEKRMESVRDLSWGVSVDNEHGFGLAQPCGDRLGESPLMGAGGFEPPQAEPEGTKRPGSLFWGFEADNRPERLH